MLRARLFGVALMAIFLAGTSCTGRAGQAGGPRAALSPSAPASRPPGAEGTCRSEVARAEAAGRASVEWITLGVALRAGDVKGPVVEFGGINDLGQDQAPQGEGAPEPARVVTLDHVTSLRGDIPAGAPLRATPYQLADAQAEIRSGSRVLTRIDQPTSDGRRFIALMVALRGDGSAAFLGDCIPRWTPALGGYAGSVGLRASDLARALLLDPSGPSASSFLSSSAASVRAGP